MAIEEPNPYTPYSQNPSGTCRRCGRHMMWIRPMECWCCKDCTWRADEAARVERGEEPWTEKLRSHLVNNLKVPGEEADKRIRAVEKGLER